MIEITEEEYDVLYKDSLELKIIKDYWALMEAEERDKELKNDRPEA